MKIKIVSEKGVNEIKNLKQAKQRLKDTDRENAPLN